MRCGWLRSAFLADHHDSPPLLRPSSERNPESSPSCAERDVERVVAMPVSIRRANGNLPRAVAISVRLSKRVWLAHSRARLVVASDGWRSILPGKASSSFLGGLQT